MTSPNTGTLECPRLIFRAERAFSEAERLDLTLWFVSSPYSGESAYILGAVDADDVRITYTVDFGAASVISSIERCA